VNIVDVVRVTRAADEPDTGTEHVHTEQHAVELSHTHTHTHTSVIVILIYLLVSVLVSVLEIFSSSVLVLPYTFV